MKSAYLCFKDVPLFLNDFNNIHEYANYAYMIIHIHMCVCKPNHHKILAVIDKKYRILLPAKVLWSLVKSSVKPV